MLVWGSYRAPTHQQRLKGIKPFLYNTLIEGSCQNCVSLKTSLFAFLLGKTWAHGVEAHAGEDVSLEPNV